MESTTDQLDREEVQEVMLLHFIKEVSELKKIRTLAKGNVADILIELVVVWLILSDIAPQYYLARLLVHRQ